MNATDFLKTGSSATEFLTGKKDVPFVIKALDFLTGHFPSDPDIPELSRDEAGRPIINVPQTASVPLLQSPEMALAAAVGGAGIASGPLLRRAGTGIMEGLGWATGGLSDIPKLAKSGAEGIAKALRAKPLAKAAEQRQAAGLFESITPEAKIAVGKAPGETILKPGIKAAEFLRQKGYKDYTADDFVGAATQEDLRNAIDNFLGVDDNLSQLWADGETRGTRLLNFDYKYGAALEEAAMGKDYDAVKKIVDHIQKKVTPEDYERLRAIKRKLGYPDVETVSPAARPLPPVRGAGSSAVATKPDVRPVGEKPDMTPGQETATLYKGRFPVEDIKVSDIHTKPDELQFKLDTNAEGVQVPLEGEWNELAAGNVLLWQAKNGKRYMVNGHHRLAKARAKSIETIKSQTLKEADGYTINDARRIGAEANILEGKGTVYDQAEYFRLQPETYTPDVARQRGIAGRGYTIGRFASPDTYTQFRSRAVSPEAAEAISKGAPSEAALQNAGVKYSLSHPRADAYEIENFIKALSTIKRPSATADLFGFDDSAIIAAEKMGKAAAAEIRTLRDKVLAVQGAAKRPETAKALGVDVKNPEAIKAKIAELKGQIEAWARWSTNPKLVAELKGRAGLSEVTGDPAKAVSPIPTVESLHPQVQGGHVGKLPKYAEGSAINLDRLDTTEDVKQLLNGMTKQLEEKIGKRTVTWDETRAQAEALGWDIPSIKKAWERKGSFSAAEIDATRQTNLNAIETLHESLRNLPADRSQWTPEVRAQLLDAVDMIKITSQAASEAGRSLNIHKKILANDPAFRERTQFARVLKILSGKGVKRTDDIIEGLRKLDFDNTAEVNKYIYNITKTPWQKLDDRAYELWINGLLSNPLTHVVNTTSNAMTLIYSGAERQVAAGIEAVRAGILGQERGFFFREGAETAFSVAKGLQDGWKRFATVYREGDKATKLDFPTSSLPEGVARFLPGRALAAEDAFFKGFIESLEMNRLAFRQARKEKLVGENLTKRVTEILSAPPPDMLNAVVAKGKYLTFQKELGEIGNLVLKSRNVVPGLKYFVPFVKTPANIMKFALERTPLNLPVLIRKAMKGELKGAQLSEELAKPLMGSMLGGTAYLMAAQGTLTGGYPEKKAEREEWQNTGKLPYSIRIGDKYYSFARIEPLATIMGLSADFRQLQERMTENEQYNVGAGIAGAISNNISDKTFMQGFSNLIEAINDPGRYGKTLIKQFAGSAVPAVSGGVARSADPYVRDVRSILDAVKSRVPGASETLPQKLTVWGDPIKRTGSPVARFLSPVQVSQRKGSPVEKEVARLSINVGYPGRKAKGGEIPTGDYWTFVKRSGQQAKALLNRMVESPSWENYPDEMKAKIIRSVVEKTREIHKAKIKGGQ